jgi:hypothetical protein
MRRLASVCFALLVVFVAVPSFAQPAGWSRDATFTVHDTSGTALTNYPARVVIDTATLIANGLLQPDADDLRFGNDSLGTTLYPYWIDSGVNTSSTIVYVRVPSIPANGTVTVHMYDGNPAATAGTTPGAFDGPFTGTNQSANTQISETDDSQRGYRFSADTPILVTQLGKNEPNGVGKTVTLFDASTQTILAQQQVSGPAATWVYQDLAPLWLTAGSQYIVEIFNPASTPNYYFGQPPTGMNSHITYYDMRYCNSCSANTFPTGILNNMLYGYVDFTFYSRQVVTPAPAVTSPGSASATSLVSDANPVTFGQNLTLTASVTGLVVSGTIAFLDGANPIAGCGSVALNSGQAQCITNTLAAGPHALSAVYSGDANNATSTGTLSQSVLATTTTTLHSNNNPSTAGQQVTFTATITGSSPGGTVHFFDNAVSIASCASVNVSGGTAICQISTLTPGPHPITASYSGDPANQPSSTSAPLSQVVTIATSATGITSTANPSSVGQTVTFTATVSGDAPTGTVTFKDGANPITGCSAVLLSGATAACTTSTLSPTSHSITAVYSGDTNNTGSTSAPLTQVVNTVTSTTGVTSTTNPSTVGQAVTFTATVSGLAPTGTVIFKDGANPITGCSAVLLSGATATCTTSTLSPASHSITAVYSGDTNNTASTSAPLAQMVVISPTTTTLTVTPSNPGPSGVVTLQAGVTGANPTGTVTFLDNGLPIGTCGAVTLSGGSATCTVTLAGGGHSLSASYSGDANNQPSVSAAVLTIAPIPALDPRALAALAALLGLAAMTMLRK